MVSDERKKELLFPYNDVRKEQNKLLLLTDACIKSKRNLIVHAPTGLGKTAATLSPALAHAIKNNLTVLFLTSRHTQHQIAIETLRKIKKRFQNSFSSASIIGKKWMCLQSGISSMHSSDFSEYCKKLKEEKKCLFYTRSKKSTGFTLEGKNALSILNKLGPQTTEQVIRQCKMQELCPYEISLGMASKAKAIIADYYYIFHPNISESFLKKIGKNIEELIVIVDEAHNLPYRLKDLASEFLTTITIKRAMKEAKKFGYENTLELLEEIKKIMEKLGSGLEIGKEKLISRMMFEKYIDDSYDIEETIADLNFIADSVRELQKKSYIGSVANFLEKWQGPDEGFARILSFKRGIREPFYSLSYRCLDPSLVSKEIINKSHSTILMSGTLLPTKMYKELLGVENCQEVVFKDPFPKKNRLNLIIPKTTTKYSLRNNDQYKSIAEILADLSNIIPGNIAVFFPSYVLRDKVSFYFNMLSKKTIINEMPKLSKPEKQELLERFKSYKETGAVLLGVASGSFGEGIDLPGDLLKAVIIVGLPLSQPDLETKSLIEYFDKKFNKGWDYGYLFPAFNKTLQNAGRCIRSEKDKGIIIFLDERFAWNNYKRCFPEDWIIEVSLNYKELVKEFFETKKQEN